MSGWVNGGIVQWGCWCGEKEKDFLCNHAGCEQAAEGNAGQELRCGTWCRRELETGVIPTELRAQVEKWRKFFHAKIQSVPVLCHVPLWSWGHGGRGGGEPSRPLPCGTCISLLGAHLTPTVLQSSGGGKLKERDGKQRIFHSRGNKIKQSIVETRAPLKFNTGKGSRRKLKLGVICPGPLKGPA